MPTFSGEITLGTIAEIVALVVIAVGIGVRFGRIETLQVTHAQAVEAMASAIAAHDAHDDVRFTAVERHISDLVKIVYTLVGAGQVGRHEQEHGPS